MQLFNKSWCSGTLVCGPHAISAKSGLFLPRHVVDNFSGGLTAGVRFAIFPNPGIAPPVTSPGWSRRFPRQNAAPAMRDARSTILLPLHVKQRDWFMSHRSPLASPGLSFRFGPPQVPLDKSPAIVSMAEESARQKCFGSSARMALSLSIARS